MSTRNEKYSPENATFVHLANEPILGDSVSNLFYTSVIRKVPMLVLSLCIAGSG